MGHNNKKSGGFFDALAPLKAMMDATVKGKPSPVDHKPAASGGAFADMEKQMIAKGVANGANGAGPRANVDVAKFNPPSPALSDHSRHHPKHKKSGKKNAQLPTPPLNKSKKLVLKGITDSMARAIYAAKGLSFTVSRAAPKPQLPNNADDRVANFHKVIGAVSNSSPNIEPRPAAIAKADADLIENDIRTGSRALAAQDAPDEFGFIVGMDFGTSSVKMAARQPYRANDPVKARSVPTELQSFAHPYLWQTVLWFVPASQSFSLFPKDGAIAIDGFKTGIIGGREGARAVADLPVTRAEAAVAFLSLQLAQFFGWYHREHPLGAVGAERFMSINIGIPVAACDAKRSYSVFSRIVAAANTALPFAEELDLEMVRDIYHNTADDLPAGFQLVPELTAAIAGFAFEPTTQMGSHLIVDVGASTLDIAAFNLVEKERISVFAAAVELLGAAALNVAQTKGISADDFASACSHEFNTVFGHARSTKRASDGFHPARRRRPVQLVVTGGGCKTAVHESFIESLTIERSLGEGNIIQLQPPKELVELSCDRSRLLLAYGLTRDLPELLDLRLPSEIPDLAAKTSDGPVYISKDMT
jgi:hypothetical protein